MWVWICLDTKEKLYEKKERTNEINTHDGGASRHRHDTLRYLTRTTERQNDHQKRAKWITGMERRMENIIGVFVCVYYIYITYTRPTDAKQINKQIIECKEKQWSYTTNLFIVFMGRASGDPGTGNTTILSSSWSSSPSSSSFRFVIFFLFFFFGFLAVYIYLI